MEEHRFVPGPRIARARKKRLIMRPVREVGIIRDKPDLDGMTFNKQIRVLGLAGSPTSIPTTLFRDHVGQLARRHPEAVMGINGKYLLHALDAGEIEACCEEVFGIDTTGPTVQIDPELTEIALSEACASLSDAARHGARIIFASSRPASTLSLFAELARMCADAGAEILDLFANTSEFIADGRRGRRITWIDSVGVLTDGASILATNDARVADDLIFHLSRPDIVVADHIFAGAAVTNGYPTLAFTSLESLAVAVATVPEPRSISIPISLSAPSSRYGIVANYAKSFFAS